MGMEGGRQWEAAGRHPAAATGVGAAAALHREEVWAAVLDRLTAAEAAKVGLVDRARAAMVRRYVSRRAADASGGLERHPIAFLSSPRCACLASDGDALGACEGPAMEKLRGFALGDADGDVARTGPAHA